jgi:hypothetical protein
MATSAITASTRFFAPEITKCYYVPTIADVTTPTRNEMDAGTDLTGEIADISGWMIQSAQIDTPDLGSRWVSQITGRTSAPSSSITLYASSNSVDVRDLLPRDTTGYILWLDGGDVATQSMDVFPVKVSSLGKQRTTGDTASLIQVDFAVTAEPQEDVTIPALV